MHRILGLTYVARQKAGWMKALWGASGVAAAAATSSSMLVPASQDRSSCLLLTTVLPPRLSPAERMWGSMCPCLRADRHPAGAKEKARFAACKEEVLLEGGERREDPQEGSVQAAAAATVGQAQSGACLLLCCCHLCLLFTPRHTASLTLTASR